MSCSPTALFILLRGKNAKNEMGDPLKYEELLREASDETKYGIGRYNSQNPVRTSLGVIEQVAHYYAGLDTNRLTVKGGDNWQLEDVSSQIDKGNPVMVNYGGCTGMLGHSVVIYGIDWDLEKLYVVDPIVGQSTSIIEKYKTGFVGSLPDECW